MLCGWWELNLGPPQEQQYEHCNKNWANREVFLLRLFSVQTPWLWVQVLGYIDCVCSLWLPLLNGFMSDRQQGICCCSACFLICKVEITTASLSWALGQLKEMVAIKPLPYGCWHLKAFCGMSYYTLLVSLKIVKLFLSGWLHYKFYSKYLLFSFILGLHKVFQAEPLAINFVWGHCPSIRVP